MALGLLGGLTSGITSKLLGGLLGGKSGGKSGGLSSGLLSGLLGLIGGGVLGGGSRGRQSSQVEIPDWIKQPSMRNIERAEAVQRLGYMPYMGLDVAGLTQPQQAAMQANIDAAAAFGLVDPGLNAMAGMPQTQNVGGIQGYSSFPMFDRAVKDLQRSRPNQAAAYNRLFVNPSGRRNRSSNRGSNSHGLTREEILQLQRETDMPWYRTYALLNQLDE